MSGDEVLVLFVSSAATLAGWGFWYLRLRTAHPLCRDRGLGRVRRVLALTPPLCLAGLFAVLRAAASFDVRESPLYLVFYLVFGAAWLVAGRGLFSLLGVSWRDDALGQRNPAAAWAVAGGLGGLMACYAGANVGDGPGWWCVLAAGALATAAWFAAWAILEHAGDLAEAVTVERDEQTALRLAGFLLAAGVLCGRGAAGDWTSAAQTLAEFRDAWPVLVLLAGAVWVERSAAAERRGPAGRTPSGPPGWLLAGFYVAFAVLCLTALPKLPRNPSCRGTPAANGVPQSSVAEAPVAARPTP